VPRTGGTIRPPGSTAIAALARLGMVLGAVAVLALGPPGPGTALARPSQGPAEPRVAVPSVNGLALTPYMGWNSYYAFGGRYDEHTIESETDALVTRGFRQAGYRYVWLDGGWWSGARAPDGSIEVNPAQWPDGMKFIADYIHDHGLLAGIYTDAGTSSCGHTNQGGAGGHYQQDADQFAAWGFDAVKVDFCGGDRDNLDPATAYAAFGAALRHNASGRPMLFNVCNPLPPNLLGPDHPPYQRSAFYSYAFGPYVANSWRTNGDLGVPGRIRFQHVLQNLDRDAAHPAAAGPGHWNDPDYLGPELGLSLDEARAQFTMWSMTAAPLILGDDVRTMSEPVRQIVTAGEVIAIDQDPLGVQGIRFGHQGSVQFWVKPLADGGRAIALLNRAAHHQRVNVSLTGAGLDPSEHYEIRDVWARHSFAGPGRIAAFLRPHEVLLYRFAPRL